MTTPMGRLREDNKALEEENSELRAQLDAKWISAGERLPDCPYQTGGRYLYSADVLIFTEDGIFIGSYCLGEGWNEQSGSRVTGVTHWQPLPLAPSTQDGAKAAPSETQGGGKA